MATMPPMHDHKQGTLDPLRDTPLRFLAFSNDLGEAFKPFISKRVYLISYGMVGCYGLADTILKGWQALQRAQHAQRITPPPPPPRQRVVATLAASVSSTTPMLHWRPGQPGTEAASPEAVALAAMADAALWHTAASVVIPGAIINRAVWATRTLLRRAAAPAPAVATVPTAVGLVLIPLLVRHIDEAVTKVMASNVRPHLPPHAC